MDTEKNNFSPLRKISEENDSEFFKIINIENEINSEFIIKNENETEEKKNNEKNDIEEKKEIKKVKKYINVYVGRNFTQKKIKNFILKIFI